MQSSRLLCLLVFSTWQLLAQNYATEITDGNPFDPNRGQKPAPVEEEAAIVPEVLPVLDGTVLFGESKFAIFSYYESGEAKSKRATIKDTFAGYEVMEIDQESAVLQGGGRSVTVKLFAGNKQNRGGSKAAPRAEPAKPDADKGPQLVSPGGSEGAPTKAPTPGKPAANRFKKVGSAPAPPTAPLSKTVQEQAPGSKQENAKGKI
jgi:hypothetical protein